MRIGVDARHLTGNRGVARYTHATLRELTRSHPEHDWRLFVAGGGAVGGLPDPPCVRVIRHPLPSRVLFGTAALVGAPRLDRLLGGVDVLWQPAPAPFAWSQGVPLVLTVHDLSFVTRPSDYTPYERVWHRLARPRAVARAASRVVSVSHATRNEMLARWEVQADRVVVVSPGVNPRTPGLAEELDAVRAGLGLPDRYLLFVGALEPRKAPEVLAAGFAHARSAGLDAGLVVVGDGRRAGVLRGPGVTHAGHLEGRDLEAAYDGALALVMPSWLEGFGLPPLEAAVRGVPSIVTDLPVFTETLGDATVRVPLGDPDALGEAMVRIADDGELRRRLGEAARAAVGRLTWAGCAEGVHAALVAAVEGGG